LRSYKIEERKVKLLLHITHLAPVQGLAGVAGGDNHSLVCSFCQVPGTLSRHTATSCFMSGMALSVAIAVTTAFGSISSL
jgi:hypothetical protein